MRIGKLIAVAGIIFSITLSSPAATTNKVIAAKNYTQEQAEAFNRKADREFHKLGKQLDDLKAQSQQKTGDAKAALDKKVAEAQQKIDELKPDRKSTRLNSSHRCISYAVFCLKKKRKTKEKTKI